MRVDMWFFHIVILKKGEIVKNCMWWPFNDSTVCGNHKLYE